MGNTTPSILLPLWHKNPPSQEGSWTCPSICSLSELISSWIDEGIDFCSRLVFQYRQEIFYTGMACSVAAVVAALVGSIGFLFFSVAAAGLAFGIAAWAFREREEKLARDLSEENARFLRSVEMGNANLAKERENVARLEEAQGQLAAQTARQEKQIEELEEDNGDLTLQVQELTAVKEKLQSQLQRLLRVESKLRPFVFQGVSVP